MLDPIPSWSKGSLQGFAYWLGWNDARYPDWPLSEGAMIAELQRAISGAAGPGYSVQAELDTAVLTSDRTLRIKREGRVDLTILRRPDRVKLEDLRKKPIRHVDALIEVKRGGSSSAKFKEDLERLAALRPGLPKGARCFLIVGCQGSKGASRFVKDGKARTRLTGLGDVDCRVRRVLRASPAHRDSSVAHLVILVEVFGTRQPAVR